MRGKVEIIGYYKRKRGGNEYILYTENGRLCLTNGICIWRDFVEKKYLPQLEKADRINLVEMKSRLKRYFPYSLVLKRIQED